MVALCLGARPANAESPIDDQVGQQIQAACTAFPGSAAVVVADPQGGFRYGVNDQRSFPAASLYKLAVLIEAYRQDALGQISLDDTRIVITEDDITDSGYFTPAGTPLSVREAVERMITISDNSPALALVRLLDAHQINATMVALGLTNTRLNTPLPDDERTSSSNVTTASDMATLFVGLARGQIVSPGASRDMLAVLARQQINDRLPAGVPAGVTVAHKTGDLPGVAHDAGIIWTPNGPRVVVMLTSDFASFDDVTTLAENLGSLAYGAPLDRFAARYALNGPTGVITHPDAPLSWTLRLTNASSMSWTSATALAVRWLSVGQSPTRTETGALPLANLAPGSSITVPISVTAPSAAGSYVLELEVVDPTIGSTGNRMPIVVVVTPP
jgi:beta-lactamase class A